MRRERTSDLNVPTHWDGRKWGWYVGCWVAGALILSVSSYLSLNVEGSPVRFWPLAAREGLMVIVYTALTPSLLVLARWFPLRESFRLKDGIVQFVGLLLFSCVTTASYFFIDISLQLVSGMQLFTLIRASEMSAVLHRAEISMVLYGIVFGATIIADERRNQAESQRKSMRLEAQIARAELDSLRKQIHPRFLIQVLSTIIPRIEEDPQQAALLASDLRRLLLNHLEEHQSPLIPLTREVEFLKGHVSLVESERKGMLEVLWDIDPHATEALVPTLLLEPLLENALQHGQPASPSKAWIRLRFRRVKASLVIEVRDNGPGLPPSRAKILIEGHSLQRTERRLSYLFGARHRMRVQNATEGGAIVRIEIPWIERTHRKRAVGTSEVIG
jgi:two-component system, LytTR family, sensor kinase